MGAFAGRLFIDENAGSVIDFDFGDSGIDFRGLNRRSFDGRGNYSMGVKEQIMFPEIDYDQIDMIRGMDITITTNAKTDEEALALLQAFNFPFRER